MAKSCLKSSGPSNFLFKDLSGPYFALPSNHQVSILKKEDHMTTMMVFGKVKPEKQEEFLQVLLSLANDQEKHEGLRKSTLYQETDDRTRFSLIYEWETQRDLEKYTRAEKFMVLLGALKVLCQESVIEVHPKPATLLSGEGKG